MKPRIQSILNALEKHEAAAPGAIEGVSPGAFKSGSEADRLRSLSNHDIEGIAAGLVHEDACGDCWTAAARELLPAVLRAELTRGAWCNDASGWSYED